MRKLKKLGAVMMAAMLTMGVFTGCNNKDIKPYEVSYTYNADEYINLGAYSKVEVELGDYTVTDEQLQNVIDQVVEKYVKYETVERAAQEGDQVVVAFDAYISGSKVGGFSSEEYELVIGSNSFLVEGFEEKLIGLSAGDARAITGLKIPENFTQEASYAGKSVTFDIEIIGVYGPVYPVYTDDFVNEISEGKYTTTAEYDKMLMGQLENNAVINRYNDKYDVLLDKIISSTTLKKDLPAEYVEQKEEEVTRTAGFYAGLYDYTTEEYVEKMYGVPTAKEAAENIVMMEFIFQQIIANENFVVTPKYYEENLLATAQKRNYNTTEKLVADYTQDGVIKLMLMDMAEDFIMTNAVEVSK